MTEVLVLLAACSVMGYFYTRLSRPVLASEGIPQKKKNKALATILFIILLVTLICFSGLRTRMNDTATYINSFVEKTPSSLFEIKDIDWSIGANPFFTIYQIVLKTLISESSHIFIFITSCIVTTSMMLFIRKYSLNFGYSLFLSFTVFAFTMAAMKQTIATSIAIWALPQFLNGKKFKAAIIILFAMLIHPYVVIYFVVFFASKTIWDRKTFIMILVALAFIMFYESVLNGVLGLTSSIGDEYDMEWFTTGGVNVLRIAVYLVTPLLSFVYRKQIQKNADDMSLIAINLSVVSALFIMLASLGAANMFGRMANYFDLFQCLALPVIFKHGLKTRNEKIFLGTISVICFTYFYYSYYSKYLLSYNSDCFYEHISFLEMLKSW